MSVTFGEIIKLNFSLVFSLLALSTSNVSEETAIAQYTQGIANSSLIPNSLKVPSGQQLLLKASAKGTQIYVCKAKSAESPVEYEWTLKAPDAILLNEQGQDLGKHYAGPTWEAKDGSKVVAEVKSKANAPQEDAIPWLLLGARSHEGNGIFRQVNWIQRINTVGGKAPIQGCNNSSQNREIRVNYTADYLFYGGKTVSRFFQNKYY
jgi:Protein of unknown function (DUF3455)